MHEGSEVASWEGWESSEVTRWEVCRDLIFLMQLFRCTI